MIAALYVEPQGVYAGLLDVDPWPESRDARTYQGPHPVVAHPPCQRWGRYWSGGPSAKVRRTLGDDGGCFAAALHAVDRWGGVLEHPEASHAFGAHGILWSDPTTRAAGGWQKLPSYSPAGARYVCQVEQGHYGHPARKKTWLYYVGRTPPPELIWGPSQGMRLDEGFHSKAERLAARAAGKQPIPRLTRAQNLATPIAFRDLLISIARNS